MPLMMLIVTLFQLGAKKMPKYATDYEEVDCPTCDSAVEPSDLCKCPKCGATCCVECKGECC